MRDLQGILEIIVVIVTAALIAWIISGCTTVHVHDVNVYLGGM